jgi:type IV secretion system protein VirB6
MALQQGGLGVVLTMLIMTTPPMAAMFFQGTMGSFLPYSQFGGGAGGRSPAPGPQGQPPGSYHPLHAAAEVPPSGPGAVRFAMPIHGQHGLVRPSGPSGPVDAIKMSP